MKSFRRQWTSVSTHSDEKSPQENFDDYCSASESRLDGIRDVPQMEIDRRQSGPVGNSQFTYRLRMTRTTDKTVAGVTVSPHILNFRSTGIVQGNFTRILHVLKGRAALTMRGKTSTLDRGSTAIMDPYEQCVIVSKTVCEMLVVTVPSECFHAIAGRWLMEFQGHVFHLRTPLQEFFKNMMLLLNNGFENLDARDADCLCHGMLCFLRPILLEHFRETCRAEPSSRDLLRNKAIDSMSKHLRNSSAGLEDIARECGVSVRYLSEIFSDIGTTPAKYFRQMRLDLACEYLRETTTGHMSVENIALQCGFADCTHFCRVFKERYGMTALRFRKLSDGKSPSVNKTQPPTS